MEFIALWLIESQPKYKFHGYQKVYVIIGIYIDHKKKSVNVEYEIK